MTRKPRKKLKRERIFYDTDGEVNNSMNQSISSLYSSEKKISKEDKCDGQEKEKDSLKEIIEKALNKRLRLKNKYIINTKSNFDNLGGIDEIIQNLKKFLQFDKIDKNSLEISGVSHFPRRILIQGVSGVGKSKLAESIANHLGLQCLKCNLSRFSSATSSEIRSLFSFVRSIQPCVLIIDKLDQIAKRRQENQVNLDNKHLIFDNLIDCLEELNEEKNEIVIIGIVDKINEVDPEFLNVANFIKEVSIEVPDFKGRTEILKKITQNVKFSDDVDLKYIAFNTPGYVGADLCKLITMSCLNANLNYIGMEESKVDCKIQNDIHEDNIVKEQTKCVSAKDIEYSLKAFRPSLKGKDFASIPNVTWADIGGLHNIRKRLRMAVLYPVKYPQFMKATMWEKSCGVLMYGPPGCGKTSIAKALANEGGINFISIKGPEILNMYVGESERRIRSIFESARKAKPCVIFFDEIDALCKERSEKSEKTSVTNSVLSQLLTEMDGFDNSNCKVLAATNRIDVLDRALLRPGRFGTILKVDIPTIEEKIDILRAITRDGRPPFDEDVSLLKLGQDKRLIHYTGADLKGLLERAHEYAMEDIIEENFEEGSIDIFKVKWKHLEKAINEVKFYVDKKMAKV